MQKSHTHLDWDPCTSLSDWEPVRWIQFQSNLLLRSRGPIRFESSIQLKQVCTQFHSWEGGKYFEAVYNKITCNLMLQTTRERKREKYFFPVVHLAVCTPELWRWHQLYLNVCMPLSSHSWGLKTKYTWPIKMYNPTTPPLPEQVLQGGFGWAASMAATPVGLWSANPGSEPRALWLLLTPLAGLCVTYNSSNDRTTCMLYFQVFEMLCIHNCSQPYSCPVK